MTIGYPTRFQSKPFMSSKTNGNSIQSRFWSNMLPALAGFAVAAVCLLALPEITVGGALLTVGGCALAGGTAAYALSRPSRPEQEKSCGLTTEIEEISPRQAELPGTTVNNPRIILSSKQNMLCAETFWGDHVKARELLMRMETGSQRPH